MIEGGRLSEVPGMAPTSKKNSNDSSTFDWDKMMHTSSVRVVMMSVFFMFSTFL